MYFSKSLLPHHSTVTVFYQTLTSLSRTAAKFTSSLSLLQLDNPPRPVIWDSVHSCWDQSPHTQDFVCRMITLWRRTIWQNIYQKRKCKWPLTSQSHFREFILRAHLVCMSLLTAVLFVIAGRWKQLQRLSTHRGSLEYNTPGPWSTLQLTERPQQRYMS